MLTLQGTAASPGIAIGQALVYVQKIKIINKKIDSAKIDQEIEKFENGLKKSVEEETFIKEKVKKEIGEKEAEIFQAHILMLQDPTFVDGVKNKIKNNLLTSEEAVFETTNELVEKFSKIENEYLRQRARDIQDIGNRVLRNLLGLGSLINIPKNSVVVTETLTPSDVASMDVNNLAGLVIEETGITSHVIILSRQLRIPAVINISNVINMVKSGQTIIVDGSNGIVIIDPDQSTLNEYMVKSEEYKKELLELNKYININSVTLDGRKIEVAANVGNLNDVELALKYGAEGIGLLRTEFLYLDRESPQPAMSSLNSIEKLLKKWKTNRS